MKNNHTRLVCATILIIGLINARVLNAGFEMLRNKGFSSSSSSSSPSVAALPGDRFVIIDNGTASIFRIDSNGKITPETFSRIRNGDYSYRSFEPFPTPIPTPSPYAGTGSTY